MLLLYLIFRTATVQTWLTGLITDKLSEDLKTEISIEGVDLSWFMNIVLEGVSLNDRRHRPLFKADKIVAGLKRYSSEKRIIRLSKVEIDGLYFALRTYKGDSVNNLQFITDYFASDDTTKKAPFRFGVNSFTISHGHFIFDDENAPRVKDGMDYSHLNLKNINILLHKFKTDTSYFFATVDSISATDTCGFTLSSLQGKITLGPDRLKIENLKLKTPYSDIKSQFAFDYKKWSDWNDFINKIKFNTLFDSSQVDARDIIFFAPTLKGTQLKLALSGKVGGTVSNLKLRKFKFFTGKKTFFEGKLNINGLPDITESFIDIKTKKLVSNVGDLKDIRLPGGESIPLPENLKRLKNINIEGRFTGFYNDFVSNATFKTALGNIRTDLLIQPLKDTNALGYNGKIALTDFDLGSFVDIDGIGKVSLKGEIKGKGLNKNADADIDILVSSIKLSKYTYLNSKIKGRIAKQSINASIKSRDSIFKLYATGLYKFGDSMPLFNFFADVENARLSRLFLSQSDTFGTISGRMNVDITGDNIDNITGEIHIDSLIYKKNNKTYYGDSLTITSTLADSMRDITLNSKYIDGNIKGNFRFDNLGSIYPFFIDNFLPALTNSTKNGVRKTQNKQSIETARTLNFKYNFDLKDTKDLSEILLPYLQISDNSNLHGIINLQANSLDVNFQASSLKYDGFDFDNLKISLLSHIDTFDIVTAADKISLTDSIYFDSVRFRPMIYRDSIQMMLSYGKKNEKENKLFMEAGIHFPDTEKIEASIGKLDLMIHDTLWQLDDYNYIKYKRHYLSVSDFRLVSGENSFALDGIISDKAKDKLNLSFKNFEIGFFNFIFSRYYTNLKGKMNGDMELSTIWKQPGFLAEFDINNLVFNGSPLGTASINGIWSEARNAVGTDIVIKNERESVPLELLNLSGYLYPERKSDNLEMKLKINDFPLKSLQPYLSSFSSNIQGKAFGALRVKGTPAKPEITGKLLTDISNLQIDYLKTNYSLKDSLIFAKDYFGFEKAKVFDKKHKAGQTSHSGLLTFKLHHNYFQDLKLELSLTADDLEMLNTKKRDNDLFYGYAEGDGKIKIEGPFDDLYFNIDVKPLNTSKISLPMSETTEAQTAEFIVFASKDSTQNGAKRKKHNDDFKMSMDLRLRFTPDVSVQLVMDETVGDIITAYGQGDIRMKIDKQSNVNMYGRYKISKGDYLFTMQNIINKHFILQPGGTIQWDGDIMNAKINIQAVYKTEARLYDLLQMIDTSDVYKRKSKVNCIINIKGSLGSPDISFNIDLPDESNNTKELVNMVLYASSGETNQDVMNKNFISLLMLGTFQPPSGYSAATNPNALASNATELLANQMSSWINKLSNNVDIGLTFDPGDELTNQEIAVALSYQAFNDRLLIDGKFGTGGEMKNSETSTRIVGDLNVEYKITKDGRIRAKVFNRTNYDDPLTRKAPYTQGAGIVYRKEFDSLKELFEKQNKAKVEEVVKVEKDDEKGKKEKRKKKKKR